MSKSTKRHFTREYKEEALRVWAANGGRSKETGEQLGIEPNYLPKWQRELQGAARSGAAASSSGGQPVAGSAAAEIAGLKREVERLRMERDILKKAAVIMGEVRK
jgi:transposase